MDKKTIFILIVGILFLGIGFVVAELNSCIPKTCEDLFQEGKTCGKWSNGCTGSIDCGSCPPQCGNGIEWCDQYDCLFNESECSFCPYGNYEKGHCEPIQAIPPFADHMTITCSDNCNSPEYNIQQCKFTMTYDLYGTLKNTNNSFQEVINFFGGEDYLNSLNYPFPDINIEYICGGTQHYTPEKIYVKPMDNYGTPHEMMHHMIRFYSDVPGEFLLAFEEGLTNRFAWCIHNKDSPCCNLNNGDCIVPENVCKPGTNCNYQGMQAGMMIRLAGEYGCDLSNCWKSFFYDITQHHKGETLTNEKVYLFLNNYTGKDVLPLLEEYGIGGLEEYITDDNESNDDNVTDEDNMDVTGCRVLDEAGATYTQTANIVPNIDSDACILITAENITYDGAGYWIANSTNHYIGIYSNSTNTTIRNCNISMDKTGGAGIVLVSDNNLIENNIANSNLVGIYIHESENNKVQNNTVNNNSVGIALFHTDGDITIKNNTLHSNNYSIYLSYSDNNLIENNDIWNCLHTCITLLQSVDYNVFDGNRINKSSNVGINITTMTVVDGHNSHNLFKNTNMTNIDGTSIVIDSLYGSNLNNTFLNFSYDNELVNANSELIRKWYFDGQVNFTHNSSAVQGTNVSAYNNMGDLQFSVLSAADGSITQQQLIQYINMGTTVYHSNYTITASLTGWDTDSEEINLTTNTLQQFAIDEEEKDTNTGTSSRGGRGGGGGATSYRVYEGDDSGYIPSNTGGGMAGVIGSGEPNTGLIENDIYNDFLIGFSIGIVILIVMIISLLKERKRIK